MSALRFGHERGLSHAYIAASLSETARARTEGLLSAAAVCSASDGKPCGTCRDCRKANGGVHPDIIHVRREYDDKGKLRKEIRVDQIREMIGQAQIMPNEADGKAFIVHEAERMNEQAQNALLKLLEEPPRGVVLILSTATPSMLLETVRSRCVELTGNEEAPELRPETREEVLKYLELVAKGKKSHLLAFCNGLAGRSDVAQTVEWTEAVQTVLTDILCKREQDLSLTKQKCMALLQLMDTCRMYLRVNTGVKHVFGLIAVQSIGDEAPGKRG